MVALVRQRREPAREAAARAAGGTLEEGEAPLATARARARRRRRACTAATWRELAAF
jgi:hypothetical protein